MRGSRNSRCASFTSCSTRAGFDDMHFNEMYNVADRADLPL